LLLAPRLDVGGGEGTTLWASKQSEDWGVGKEEERRRKGEKQSTGVKPRPTSKVSESISVSYLSHSAITSSAPGKWYDPVSHSQNSRL
jgi:hypothetical protein